MKVGLISCEKLNEVKNRFLSKIEKIDGCWVWKGYIDKSGYGRLSINNRSEWVHRISFYIYNGFFPKDGMVVDHICRNRKCVNPEHLREATQRQNCLENSISRSYLNSLKTHCPKGHEYSEDNTKIKYRNNIKMRYCIECSRIYARNKYGYKKIRKGLS
jgi:hypothetical protein